MDIVKGTFEPSAWFQSSLYGSSELLFPTT
jgi:hypothetical protein